MKYSTFFALFALVGLGLFHASCNDDGSINVTPNSYMRATISDTLGTADSTITFSANGTRGVKASGILTVTGSGLLVDRTITLVMPATVGTGSYSLRSTAVGSSYSAKYTQDLNSAYESTSGTLTITAHDTEAERIEGTFEFTAIGTGTKTPIGSKRVIKSGSFAANY